MDGCLKENIRYFSSTPGIRDFFDRPENKDRLIPALRLNKKYVFMKQESDVDAPTGSSGLEVVRLHSFASALDKVPLGMVAFYSTTIPGKGKEPAKISTFGTVADTGAMGWTHNDLFLGSGKNAEHAAEHMQQPGSFYVSVVKPGANPCSNSK
jgi:membrane-bound lytic murein transglycosylase